MRELVASMLATGQGSGSIRAILMRPMKRAYFTYKSIKLITDWLAAPLGFRHHDRAHRGLVSSCARGCQPLECCLADLSAYQPNAN